MCASGHIDIFIPSEWELECFLGLNSYSNLGHTHEDIDQMFSRIAVWLPVPCLVLSDTPAEGESEDEEPPPLV